MKKLLLQSNLYVALLLSALFIFSSCEDDSDDKNPTLEIPSAYDASSYTANTVTQQAVLDNLSGLSSKMKEGRGGAALTAGELTALFDAGSPSLHAVTTSYYTGRVEDDFLTALAAASGNEFDLDNVPSGTGGVLGSYLLDETGLELEQLVEKGLFGAALYNHALTLRDGEVSAATIDQLLCIYGAQPDFPNSDKASNPDKFSAKYAARRDKNDGTGFYRLIEQDLIKAQAAAKGGSVFNTELNEALDGFFLNWERSNAATVVNYCLAAVSKLSKENPSPEEIGSAMHSYSEGVGFLHGWRTLPAGSRVITDSEIDELLTLMKAPQSGTGTSYLFFTDSFNQLPELQKVVDRLQSIYGFTDAQITDFEKNWVSEQGRQ